MLISCMTAGYLSLKPLSIKQMGIYSMILPLASCFLWMKYSWIIILMVEVLFFLLYFRLSWKTYLLTLSLRFLLSFSWYACFRGGFHNFQYFFPIRSPFILLISQCVILWLLYRKWNYWVGKLNYVYECQIEGIPNKHSWKGYLDSGNMLMMNDIPVIFIDNKYESYFHDANIQYLVMNTMSGSAPIACFEGRIKIQGMVKKRVYIRCEKNIQLPMQCQILLNVNLWLG